MIQKLFRGGVARVAEPPPAALEPYVPLPLPSPPPPPLPPKQAASEAPAVLTEARLDVMLADLDAVTASCGAGIVTLAELAAQAAQIRLALPDDEASDGGAPRVGSDCDSLGSSGYGSDVGSDYRGSSRVAVVRSLRSPPPSPPPPYLKQLLAAIEAELGPNGFDVDATAPPGALPPTLSAAPSSLVCTLPLPAQTRPRPTAHGP